MLQLSIINVIVEKQANGLWRATAQCKVNPAVVDNKLAEEIKKYKRVQDLFGHRRVIVITPTKENTPELKNDPDRVAGLKELRTCLKSYLQDKGFRVFKEGFAKASFQEIVEALREYLYHPLYAEIMEENNEFVIAVDMQKREDKGKTAVKAWAESRSLGREFVTLSTEEFPLDTLENEGSWEKAARMCADVLQRLLLEKLILQISEFGTGSEYILNFRGFASNTHSTISNVIMGLKSLSWSGSMPSSPESMTADIGYTGTDLLSEMEKNLGAKGINVDSYSTGNLLIFVNADVIFGIQKRWWIMGAAVIVFVITGLFLIKSIRGKCAA